jgi:uncharacterized membrane protein YhhN
MKKLFLFLFLLASTGELVSNVVAWPFLHTVCKPAIVLALLGYYWMTQREQKSSVSLLMVMALFFSWVGDVLLMGEGESFFIYGLVSFLTAHVLYIFVYRQHRYADDSQELKGLQRVRFAFPIVFAGIGLVTILYTRLAELRIPVMVYAGVITIMTLNALFRYGRTNTSSFAMVFGGAILFMISDSLLAINKFLEPLSYSGVWIMLTYIGAQFLIVKGLLLHQEKE